MRSKNRTLVNTRKLFLVPITVIFIIVLILGYFSMSFSQTVLREKMINDGIIIAKQFANKIADSRIASEIINENLEKKLSEIGSYVLENKDSISSDYLAKLSEAFNVDEIYYFSAEGEIIYSATYLFIGWKATPEDPQTSFMESDLIYFREGIRKGTDTDNWFKFSYFKHPDGSFVQVGYHLENYILQTEHVEIQRIIENELSKNDVFYILITDKDLISIADSDSEDIGIDWSNEEEFKIALAGKSIAYEWFYPKRNEKILEVAVPIYENNQITGVLAYGSSLAPLRAELSNNLLRIFLVLILTVIVLIISQRNLILVPLQKLKKNIRQFSLDGEIVHKLPVNPSDPFLGVVESFNSAIDAINTHVSEINRVNTELNYAANYDFVTEIRNRRALMDFLPNIKLESELVAFCVLDINGLKEINDVYGHNVGDIYLKTIALRLAEYSKDVESFRFGGDQFFLIIRESNLRLTELLDVVIKFVSAPIIHNNEPISVRFCIGVSLSIIDGTDADELIRKADIAMYSLKEQNEDGYRYYVESLNESIQFNECVYKELTNAINSSGFELLYQPIIETSSQNVTSFEALLKMKNLSTSPSVFIPIAERKSLIGKITYIVIDQVLNQLNNWKQQGFNLVPISINISPRLFVLDNLYNYFIEKLKQYNLNSHYIELEITEEVLIADKENVIEFIDKYHSIGIRVSLDDFGSGYSSLNYLTHIRFDKVKLDKTIIDKYLNQDNYRIIKSIIEIIHELNLPIVAEGVEFQEQYELLKEFGCDQIQGYLFSKPVDEITIEQKYLKIVDK